jgi:hypothetical protein
MRLLLLVEMVTSACTVRNPAYCGDGTCIDPGRPYCDLDGSIGMSRIDALVTNAELVPPHRKRR